MLPFSSQMRLHLVNTYGRSRRSLIALATIVSEWPSPYTAAVSIQFNPRSRPAWMASMESLSFCGPQANSHFPPPIAHEPRPIRVICKSLFPSCRRVMIKVSCSWSLASGGRRKPPTLCQFLHERDHGREILLPITGRLKRVPFTCRDRHRHFDAEIYGRRKNEIEILSHQA